MVRHILKNALMDHKSVMIIYDHEGEITERLIKVIRVENNNIIAFCCLKEDIRKFKIDNILAARYSMDFKAERKASNL